MRLSKKIYDRDAVISSVKAFKEVCDLKMREEEGYFVIESSKKILDEFGNYVLQYMRN